MRTELRDSPGPTMGDSPKDLGVSIRGLGSYLPAGTITNADLERMVDTSDEWIVTRTGIRSRHRAATEEATSDLALPAAKQALAQAGLAPSDLDLIILATATPDSPVPPASCWLHKGLAASNAAAMDLSAACTGFLYGVHVGSGLIRAGMHRNVLVVGAETLTRMTDYQDRATSILFGDGAGAVVLGQRGGLDLLYSSIGCDGRFADVITVAAGGSREPASAKTVEERRHFLRLRGQEVFRRAVSTMVDAAEQAIAHLGLRAGDIARIVPHQANGRIIAAVGESLGLGPDRVVTDMSDVGNTSAASLPIALDRLLASGNLKIGDIFILVGFGAGLTWGCQVYRCTGWHHTAGTPAMVPIS